MKNMTQIKNETKRLVLSGSGNFTEALQEPRVLEYLQRYNGQQTEVERTRSGGWAVFLIIKEA
jgi:hypothetical protein